MHIIVGVFRSQNQAENAAATIEELVGRRRVHFVVPGEPEAKVHALPTTEDMSPVSAYLTVTLGAALGLGLGAVVFVVLLEWPIAMAILATLALGGLGALILGLAGRGVDADAFQGLPADELYLYKDALRQGRSIVVVRVNEAEQAAQMKELMSVCGAEAIDPARKDSAVGLGSAEDLEYEPERHADSRKVRELR